MTGHSEFEYVYKAIQHRDVSFILKAEDIEKVIQVIEEKGQFEQLSIPMNAQWPVTLVTGKIDKLPEGSDYMQQMQLMYSVRQVIRRYLATRVNIVMVLDENHRIVILAQPKESLTNIFEAKSDLIEQTYMKTVSYLKGSLEIIQSAY